MTREPRTCLLMAIVSVGMLGACGKESSSDWVCSTKQVPNGQTTDCVASGLTVADGTYAGCPLDSYGEPACPPGQTHDGPPVVATPEGGTQGALGAGGTEDGAGGKDDNGKKGDAGERDTGAAGAGDLPTGEAGDDTHDGKGKGGSIGAGEGGSSGGGWECVVTGGVVQCHKTECTPGAQVLTCGACVANDQWIPYDDCLPPETGGCWVTGGGYVTDVDGNDSFGGNGMPMKDGRIRGEWEHVDHGTGNKLHGEVSYLLCRHVDEAGPGQPSGPKHDFNINQAYYGGPARWFSNGAWADGYWFDIMAEDHGEPGNASSPSKKANATPDYYHLRVLQRTDASQSGTLIYETQGEFDGGNFQLHPPNGGHPYTSASLPTWVQLEP